MLDDNSTHKVPPTGNFPCCLRNSIIPSEPTRLPTPPATPVFPSSAELPAPPTSLQHSIPAESFITTPWWTYPSLAEYCSIRSILLLYWHIFNLVLEYECRPSVYHVQWMKTGWNRPSIITEVPCRDSNGKLMYAIGSRAHGPSVSLLDRLARNKHNHCDFSIQLFLIYLEPALKRIGATITWLTVQSKPIIIHHLEGEPPDPFVRHSVFSITTRTGAEYIADFTMEQFGFNIENLLMHKRYYENMYTTHRQNPQPSTEEIEKARRGKFKDWNGKGWAVKEVCSIMTFHRWNSLDEGTRLLALEILVRQISTRRWGWHPDYCTDLTCSEHFTHARN